MVTFYAWLWKLQIDWNYHPATAPDYANDWGPQPECMELIIYHGGVDVTDDLSEEEFNDARNLCFADKESEDTWICDLWDSMKEQLEPFYSSGEMKWN